MEIKDWAVAREIDIAAAVYVHGEEVKQAVEREKRDREFWIRAFGGEVPSTEMEGDVTLEEVMSRSALGSH